MKNMIIDMMVKLYSRNKFHRNAVKAIRELNECTDRELADMGINRYEIRHKVYSGYPK